MIQKFDFEEELKKLPMLPGVYLMHDETDEIIYVGKAVKLRNRVRQYFRPGIKRTQKINNMIAKIAYFEYIVTDSELEALILECNLIKEHNPKYNTLLKDGKSYPYIKVTVNEDFPRIFSTRQMKRDKARYFGPYTSGKAVNDTILLVQKIFKIRQCRSEIPKTSKNARPCLNYQIKKCLAPCVGYVSKEEYHEAVNDAIRFLSGEHKEILKDLEEKMAVASENMEYEQAAEYRDLIASVKYITGEQQKITNDDFSDRDIIACDTEGTDAVVSVFMVRAGKLLGREHYHMKIDAYEEKEHIVTEFLKQYYGGTPFIPHEVLVQCELEESTLLEEFLSVKRGKKVSLIIPKRGEKHGLMELALKNARMVLDKDTDKIRMEEARTTGAVRRIAEILDIPDIIRMEAYDISNTAGYESVGSMVVFENGKPKKNDYRKFKIKTVVGPNDYASMKEVLTRRFMHGINERNEGNEENSFTHFPDLILMDGGRGQVNICLEVLDELDLNIPVCGMVKDDRHRTRGLYYDNAILPIDVTSEEFKLITRIQDEAHRFAIEFHKSLRAKGQVHSVLDDIEYIGPSRRKALMRYFASLEDIAKAPVEELLNAEGMNEKAAQSVYDFFHKNREDTEES